MTVHGGPGRRHLWYDADGNPIGIEEANRLLGSRDRIIAQDAIGELRISTIHLVLDHNLDATGPPLIFDTIARGMEGGEVVVRWLVPTRHAALALHDQVCAAARDGAPIGSVQTELQY